ncbi:hypothetical protein OWR29_15430 [Actinoplanes sp. Pm04-4]|uniref:Uncharacterized protein n=1 Tax=Paractinoplanes pyxinae TaxID=2997416 RepID=A0ABT4B0E7_9ACTN|nr:hypothetical protein [Actinoplanes pyxinae]MCY1139390.1 hypothetical protein [Actinoplanes pyxinae]
MDIGQIRDEVAFVELALSELPDPELDLSDPGVWEKLRAEPPSIDRAGVRAEATAALGALLDAYEAGPEETRHQVREILHRHTRFAGDVGLPHDWTTPAEFRREVLRISAVDQGVDARDQLVALWGACERARGLGIDVGPVLREVSAISSDTDHYGMGSMQQLIMRGLERH